MLFLGFAAFGVLATQLSRYLPVDTVDARTIGFVLPMLVLMLVWGAMLFRDMFRPVSVDFEELARAGGKQAVPVLLEALRSEGGVRINSAACRQALIEYLPQLQVTDAALLKVSDRQHFNYLLERLLTTAEWSELHHAWALAILKAYAQVGDAAAIPVVERIAKHKPRNEKQQQLQQAAQECLPLLRANAGGVDTTQTLLRPSLPDTNTPDTLLRAATFSSPTPEGELLRAANGRETPPSA